MSGIEWNFDMDSAPRDGSRILIVSVHNIPAVVYATKSDDMYPGWTSNGGDRYDAVAWYPIILPDGSISRDVDL